MPLPGRYLLQFRSVATYSHGSFFKQERDTDALCHVCFLKAVRRVGRLLKGIGLTRYLVYSRVTTRAMAKGGVHRWTLLKKNWPCLEWGKENRVRGDS